MNYQFYGPVFLIELPSQILHLHFERILMSKRLRTADPRMPLSRQRLPHGPKLCPQFRALGVLEFRRVV